MGLFFHKKTKEKSPESFKEHLLKERYAMLISYGVQKDTAVELTLQPDPFIYVDEKEKLHYKPTATSAEIVLTKKSWLDFGGGVNGKRRRTSYRLTNVRAKRRTKPSSLRRRTFSPKFRT